MAQSTINEFLAVVAANRELEAEMGKVLKNTSDPKVAIGTVVEMGAKNGFRFSAEELSEFLARPKGSGELSAAELEGVAGGKMNWAKATIGSTTIYCYICAMGTSG
jgi:hypothetical protein